MMLTIVTGASENHSKSLRNFLNSIARYADMPYRCIVFDLGLKESTRLSVQSTFSEFEYRTFDFSKHPSYFNIHIEAGQYAWKAAILAEVVENTRDALIWCDAGNLIKASLTQLYRTIKSDAVFSITSSGNIRKWTHPLTLRWFGIDSLDPLLEMQNRAGGVFGVDAERTECREFVMTLNEFAHLKECIAPEGSNRSNHRQDQAVMTIQYYRFRQNHICATQTNETRLISVHNDCD